MNVLDEIRQKYQTFGDAVINSIVYQVNNDKEAFKTLVLCITCFNWQTDQWEKIKIKFINVICFRFIETVRVQSIVIFEALLKQNDGGVIVDFFPIQVNGLGKLEQDPNSSFSVQCIDLECEVLS